MYGLELFFWNKNSHLLSGLPGGPGHREVRNYWFLSLLPFFCGSSIFLCHWWLNFGEWPRFLIPEPPLTSCGIKFPAPPTLQGDRKIIWGKNEWFETSCTHVTTSSCLWVTPGVDGIFQMCSWKWWSPQSLPGKSIQWSGSLWTVACCLQVSEIYKENQCSEDTENTETG